MLDEQSREDLIERITAIFTNEADAAAFNEDPDAYAEDNLPEGTTGEDVSSCLPEVSERTGLDFSNVASTGGGATAAGQISHTYQTIYQQNSYIYAEEGSQVTNIQGDGNAVAQQDVDVDIDVEYGEGEDTPPEETPEEATEPVILREAEDADGADGGYDGSGINPDGMYDEPQGEEADPVASGIDLSFENTADAGGAEEAPAEAPAPEPADDPVDM
jgi:hypothetical protein